MALSLQKSWLCVVEYTLLVPKVSSHSRFQYNNLLLGLIYPLIFIWLCWKWALIHNKSSPLCEKCYSSIGKTFRQPLSFITFDGYKVYVKLPNLIFFFLRFQIILDYKEGFEPLWTTHILNISGDFFFLFKTLKKKKQG